MDILESLAGGILIGLSASLMLLLNGRIAGISGITRMLLVERGSEWLWRALFVVGLVGGVALVYALSTTPSLPTPRPDFPLWLLALAGFLVGYGTSMGNGCTSGHGVCGLGRLSRASLAATLTFMLTAILATYVVRHLFGVL